MSLRVITCRVGRRKLLLAGGAQMMCAQVAATVLIYFAFQAPVPTLYSLVLIEIVICIFTSAFCYSYGPLAWLVPTGGPRLRACQVLILFKWASCPHVCVGLPASGGACAALMHPKLSC